MLIANQSPQPTVPDRLLKGSEFGFLSLGHEFDSAIGQVSHQASDFKPRSNLPGYALEVVKDGEVA